MAPSRARGAAEDSKLEASGSKGKLPTHTGLPSAITSTTSKARRDGQATAGPGSSLKEVTAASSNAVTTNNGGTSGSAAAGASGPSNSAVGSDGSGGISWSSLDPAVLHAYRHAYHLPTPSAFSSSYNQIVLSNPGIGRYSPSMARCRDQRRVSKEQLALAVRKNFNSLAIQEGEVVVDFLYKVRWQDKNFRMRFAPSKTR